MASLERASGRASSATTSSSSGAGSLTPQTVEAFLCDNCRCPIGSIWDVLPAEANAPAWRDHVYSYELDLFANGAPPIQAYSATNPSKRRFDLLRLAPQVTVHRRVDATMTAATTGAETVVGSEEEREVSAVAPSTSATASQVAVHDPGDAVGHTALSATRTVTTHAPALVDCETTVYSAEHSFFTGYAWCFCHCGNCGAFLGWGFASEERLRAAARTRACEDALFEGEKKKKKMRRSSVDGRGNHNSSSSSSGEHNNAHRTAGGEGVNSEVDARGDAAVVQRSTDATPAPPPPRHGSLTRRSGADGVNADGDVLVSAAQASRLSSPTSPGTPALGDGSDHLESTQSEADNGDEESGSWVDLEGEEEDDELSDMDNVVAAPRRATGVAPDFIGIIITNCTGEPAYPVASLLHEVDWRPWRLERRRRVQVLTRELRRLLLADVDGFHAHRIYYTFESIVGRMFLTPPPVDHPIAGEGDVPVQLLDVMEVARAAVARQRATQRGEGAAAQREEEAEEAEEAVAAEGSETSGDARLDDGG